MSIESSPKLDWSSANSPQTMYFYISANEWSAAVPGTYSGTVSFNMMWGYSSSPTWSRDFDYGTIPITVTIPEPGHPVAVTYDPSEGGTVEGEGNYEKGAEVALTATPSDGYFFKEWQVVSGGVTIENDSFTMPDHAVEVKAVFEAIIPPQFTYDSDTKELHLISGGFYSWQMWRNAGVPTDEVLSVTADKGVRFVGNCTWLISDFSACERMELSAVDTSQATRMAALFDNCNALTSLDLSGWDTGAVKDMWAMFRFCKSLTNLDLSGWDTGKVMDMSSMFYDCKSLVALDLSGFDTAKVNAMCYTFSECSNLLYLDVSGFNTSAVTDMEGMFSCCEKLTELDLSSFDTRCAYNTSHIFINCSSLCRLTLSPHIAVTENMGLSNGVSCWVAEGEGTVISGDNAYADIAAPEQVTTFVWRNLPVSVFTGHSLSLRGDIGLNFYINNISARVGDTVGFEWYVKGEKNTATYTLTYDDLTDHGWCATCHLSADEINCAVNATFIRNKNYYYDVCYPSKFTYRIKDSTDEHASVSDIKIGDLSLGTKKAFSGYEVKLYLSVDEGYAPDQITLTAQDGTDVDYTLSNDDGEYFVTFTMPGQAVTLTVSSKASITGDANGDGRVDIRDVTAIQRHLAEIEPLSEQALALADTNGDGDVTIDDATHLQKYIARYDVVLGEQPA